LIRTRPPNVRLCDHVPVSPRHRSARQRGKLA
jgi:hypothetical protein